VIVVGALAAMAGGVQAVPALPPVQPASLVRAAEMLAVPLPAPMQIMQVRAQTGDLNASCMVRQILASKAEGGIDPKLAFLKPQLSKEPFNGYRSFKLLAENELTLSGGNPQSLALVTRQTLGLAYKEKLSVAGGKTRMRMQMTLSSGDKKVLDTLYAIDEGGTLLQAGQKYQDGTFVLAITCKTK